MDNKALLAALQERADQCAAAKASGSELPRVSEFIGECLLKIATHLSYKSNFVNYTYRDDMISDGVENSLTYLDNFNPTLYTNPFGYFTTIMAFAFIRRIQREKKMTYVKYKMLEKALIDSQGNDGIMMPTDTSTLTFDNVNDFITSYDEYNAKRRERRKLSKEKVKVD